MKQAINFIDELKNRYLCRQVCSFIGLLTWILVIIILTACTSSTPIQPTSTATLAPTYTATPTVVWFPPTPTQTPIPKIEPSATYEMRPGVGDLIFEDDFSTSENWLLEQNSDGTVALGLNELTIAITQPSAYIFSTRVEPIFDNFYVELTVSPYLCAGLDEYGLLFRVRSSGDFYRYSLSCDGQIRLDRVVGGTAGSPQPWLTSASVPRGAPSNSRIGVWANDRELRFFINNEFQFTVNDPYHKNGYFGVFARSADQNAVTISFSDLKVYQIKQ